MPNNEEANTIKKAKKYQTMTYMPNAIFSCQTTFQKAKLSGIWPRNANLATLAQHEISLDTVSDSFFLSLITGTHLEQNRRQKVFNTGPVRLSRGACHSKI